MSALAVGEASVACQSRAACSRHCHIERGAFSLHMQTRTREMCSWDPNDSSQWIHSRANKSAVLQAAQGAWHWHLLLGRASACFHSRQRVKESQHVQRSHAAEAPEEPGEGPAVPRGVSHRTLQGHHSFKWHLWARGKRQLLAGSAIWKVPKCPLCHQET
nr:uncharacterized protein LOC105870710 isoform X2 [Microcebus murinus]